MITIAIVAFGLLAVFGLLALASKKKEAFPATHEEVAKAIEDFVEDRGGDHDWDDFLHWKITDPFLESVRKKSGDVFVEYPATKKGHYCSDEGTAVLRKLAVDVRSKTKEPNRVAGGN